MITILSAVTIVMIIFLKALLEMNKNPATSMKTDILSDASCLIGLMFQIVLMVLANK